MTKTLFAIRNVILLIIIALSSAACDDKPKNTPQTGSTSDQSMTQSPEMETPPAPAKTESTDTVMENDSSAPPTESTPSEAAPTDASPTENSTGGAATTSPTAGGNMLALARASGCLACHSVDNKIIGPAWKDVSKRYKGDADARNRLIEKVKKGGTGNWKEVVGNNAMPPYFPRVTEENIGKLVDFILGLDSGA